MKLLFDQNISFRIFKLIPTEFSGSTHVKSLRLINAPDREIWQYAKDYGFTIVSKDSDFNDLNMIYDFPPKIIWMRTGNIKSKEVIELLIKNIDQIKLFLDHPSYGCLEIINISGSQK